MEEKVTQIIKEKIFKLDDIKCQGHTVPSDMNIDVTSSTVWMRKLARNLRSLHVL